MKYEDGLKELEHMADRDGEHVRVKQLRLKTESVQDEL